MIIYTSKFVLVALLIATSACGPLEKGNPGRDSIAALSDIVTGSSDETQAGADVSLSRAQIESYPSDLMLISVISRDVTAYIYPGAVNGAKVTWLSADGLSMTFDRGFLVGTRGFGFDMMGADISGALAGLSGTSSHSRSYDFLNGLSQIERLRFQCQTTQARRETIEIVQRSYTTTVFEERCTGESESYTNTYWQDSSGLIRQSRQWVSPGLGFIGYQLL
ncbi:YjbF family lipoprotein [Octadecabacter antarcticus]|nr:YjbF family lipoprotein [Octadecabacter antarcticus]